MPSPSVAELPEAQVDQHTGHQKEVFLETCNHAPKEYGDEHSAFAVPHPAVKKAGEKENGQTP
ncbi:hypothetical protein HNQ09_000331 [Deinococcus budaensis]|uniref:Uncharacterized protein n=1 Tax=Deinococcus budaensis TaxID=1665626 RepID=A0A7W8GC83_9DEIO|nr:hypothetical protein [Deinococcus budaensis]